MQRREARACSRDEVADKTGRSRPEPLNTGVSAQMTRMPRRDSGPELRLRRSLHGLGLRFRVQGQLPGRPDIVFSKAQIAVFVDGCFWHRCPEHSTIPKNNHEWWRNKLDANVARDRRKDMELEALGWLPVHIWEHEDPQVAALRIRDLWEKRRSDAAGS